MQCKRELLLFSAIVYFCTPILAGMVENSRQIGGNCEKEYECGVHSFDSDINQTSRHGNARHIPASGFLALLWLSVVDETNTKFVVSSWFLAALLPLVSA
jgi:hypothetical protein